MKKIINFKNYFLKAINHKREGGFSSLEILISTSIFVLVLSATILSVFSNQSVLVDAQNSAQALNEAQKLLEEEQSLSRKDFNLVNPVPEFSDGSYNKKVDIENFDDFLTKKVSAKVSWNDQMNRNLNVQLTSLATNFENAIGPNTCNSNLTGDWSAATIKNSVISLAQLIGDSSGNYPITGLDVHYGKLYVTTNFAGANKKNFFVFDVSDPANPSLISNANNNSNANASLVGATATGLTGVTVAGKYAYASGSTTKGQLQIFDLDNLNLPPVAYKLPGTTGAVGKGIAYKDGYVYLVVYQITTEDSGYKIYVIDVHDPLNPFVVGSWPSSNFNHQFNAIKIKGKYAYLTTPDNQELKIVDIEDLNNPVQVGGFDAPGGSGNGKSLYLVGDNLYLGRTVGGKELYVLDNTNPATAQLPQLGSFDLGSESLNGLIVRDYLAFALTNNKLHILNIKDPSNISPFASAINLPGAGTSGGSSLDCEGNVLFAGTYLNGGLYIISP